MKRRLTNICLTVLCFCVVEVTSYAQEPGKTNRSVCEVCPTVANYMVGNGALMIDVRESHEIKHAAFGVSNIRHIPMSELIYRWREIPKNQKVIMVCERGTRSWYAAQFLRSRDYEKVSNLEGGIRRWKTKGFPTK